MENQLQVGDIVIYQMGNVEVRGRVREIYDSVPGKRAVLDLTPEISGEYLYPEPTTVSLPVRDLHRVDPAA